MYEVRGLNEEENEKKNVESVIYTYDERRFYEHRPQQQKIQNNM